MLSLAFPLLFLCFFIHPQNFYFSWKLPRYDFAHRQTYLFKNRGKNYSDFQKIKQGSLGKEQMKCMWKVISFHFSTEWERCWRQKANWSLARSLVRKSFHCRLRLGWILGNSFVQTGRRKGMVCEEGKGGQDFLIGTLSRKGPLRSWSRVWGLPSHHIL